MHPKEELIKNGICTQEELQRLIEKFSISKANDIKNTKNYPIYEFSNEQIFLLSTPHHFLETIWQLFVENIENEEKSKKSDTFNTQRKNYTENLLEKIVRKAFPQGKIWKNLLYPFNPRNPKDKAELDLLLIYKKTALIFEVKAGRHFRPEDKYKFHKDRVKETLIDSYKQAKRFRDFLENTEKSRISQILKINKKSIEIKKVFLCCVTLDHLANFGFNTENLDLKEITYPPKDNPLTISIDDLEIILDNCNKPEIFISYLEQRKQVLQVLIEKSLKAIDELDPFGYFLDEGKLVKKNFSGLRYISNFSGPKFDEKYLNLYLSKNNT
ncbi:NERD domain-containing protein [Candidatus Babeliales bacterium]|nr:NERD domain-containing protein [Candidatus Babeliales bacterium]